MNAQDLARKVLEYPIALGCMLVAVVLGVVFFVRGLGIDDLDTSIMEMEKKRNTLSANRKNSIGLMDDLETLKEFKSKIAQRTLISEERSANIAYFYEFEANSPADMVSLEQRGALLPNKKNNHFTALKTRAVIPFAISVTGTFDECLTYMRELRTGEKMANVRSFTMSTAPSLDGSLSLDLTVHLLGQEVGK